ncbi:hypothetical protein PAAG_04017 [Paracoccidioides lutzii Pb01]|uniref:Uncharacterized protein n=1 Tax=Paracoccidioides lutzii (strain ATCC MYA-826 / Pb01) TaxID=502779 RepID=C1GZS3_PARBA|nr:hypothetical protein PAAG_04017 [Paracoccidioides lutzii Pb01]EEH42096.2 hypothetical protein PAAG_04017 [Paracoccidioides lutzii Pb01]
MVSQADTDNYIEYYTNLRMIENKLLQVKAIQNCGQRFSSTALRTTTASADAMDWQPSTTYLASHYREAFQNLWDHRCTSAQEAPKDPQENRIEGTHSEQGKEELSPKITDKSLSAQEFPFSKHGLCPFLFSHGYNLEVLDILEQTQYHENPRSPIQVADSIVHKLREAREWAEAFNVGDKFWLILENIQTDRPSASRDVRHAKYTVLEVLGSHNYRLDTPGIHDVFHTNLLQRAATDPLPSQKWNDWQPPGLLTENNELEYEIEEIRNERMNHHRQELLVK